MEAARKYDETYAQPELDAPLTTQRFVGKVAIVTGGASGIGRATVERFCNDGASVAIFDLNADLAGSLEAKMESLGKRAKFYKVDVSDKEQCVEAVKQVADDNGGSVHFLINSAAYMGGLNTPVLEVATEVFRKTMDVNVVGATHMLQACFPFMKKDGSKCSVVNFTSVRSHSAVQDQAAYSCSKKALEMLTQCMAVDLCKYGIRVNSVSPGAVWTPAQELNGVDGRNGVFETAWVKNHLTPRTFIDSAGVASVITFLCSKDAMFIDGTDVLVDCGYSAMGPEGRGDNN